MVLIQINSSYIINRCVLNTKKCGIRRFSFNSIKNVLMNYFQSEPVKPYNHICQVGDPILRMKTTPVDLKEIETREFQTILEKLFKVMRRYDLMGLSAPQIGIPLQIFVIEVQKKQIDCVNTKFCELYEVEPVPLTYFINPIIEITNSTEIMCSEACGSVTGFEAAVPRAKEVEVKAFNTLGTKFSWMARGWSARIAQHEYDHLQGTLFIDKMDSTTFQCPVWEMINLKKGKLSIKFSP